MRTFRIHASAKKIFPNPRALINSEMFTDFCYNLIQKLYNIKRNITIIIKENFL